MKMRLSVTLLATLAMCGAQAQTADLDYAQAQAQGKEDSLNPAYREWYLTQLRPAFSAVMRESLAACVPMDAIERPAIGMVLVLGQDGVVRRTVARTDSPIDGCLLTKLAAHRYPAGPKADFHFGFEAEASRAIPRSRPQANEVAARVSAPSIPEGMDCSKLLAKQARVPAAAGASATTFTTGWTVVAFDLAGDGRPQQVRIHNSSAQAPLDRFALNMVGAQTYQEGITQTCQMRLMIESR